MSLSPGAEIEIGTTKMVFKNIGAPADDEVFGTVVLDTDMLEQELAASEKLAGAGGLVRAVLGLLGLLLGVGLVIGLVMVIGRLWGSGSNGIPGNRLRNYSFDAGIDPDGSPERWKIMSRQPFRWEVDKTADRVDAKEQAGALVIHRGGGGDPLATQVSCEYLEEMQINPSRGYELSGYVRSEGAPSGIYGLKVTWAGGRGGAESHYITVAGGRAEWEPVRRVFAPPAWATHSRVACFSIGNQGKVYYDDVGFVEVERPPATVQVRQSFSKICADFDSRGIAFIKSFDRDAASDVALEIVGPGQGAITSQELAQSVSVESSARSATFSGEIYEFYNMKLVNYDLRVTPGKDGLVLHYGLACPGGLTLKTVKLRMTVETGFGAADPLLYDDSGKAIPRTSGTIRNVSEILFEVPGQDEAPDKFAIFFPARAQTAKITPRGDRKEIEIILAKDLRLSKVDTSFLVEVNFSGRFERLGVEKSLKELEGLVQEKDYPGAYQKITSVQGTYSKKFPDEVEKALGTSRQLDALADAAVKTAETRLNLLKIAETEEARVTASADLTKYLSEQKGLWQGTKHETRFAAIEVSQKNLLATRGQQLRRAEAQRLKEKADSLYDKGLYSMAKSFYSTIVSKYADTAVAEQVRTGKIIEICTSRVELNATERKLVGEALNGIKNLELNKMFKRALQKLRESDAMMRFPDNETLKAKEKELRGKIDQGG